VLDDSELELLVNEKLDDDVLDELLDVLDELLSPDKLLAELLGEDEEAEDVELKLLVLDRLLVELTELEDKLLAELVLLGDELLAEETEDTELDDETDNELEDELAELVELADDIDE